MVNLTLAHLAVFPALQNGFAGISWIRGYAVRINHFMPGNHSNIRAGGAAGEEERDGHIIPKDRSFHKNILCASFLKF